MTNNDVKSGPEPSLTELVKGIANDVGELVKQEMRFARTEIKADIRKARQAAAFLAVGSAAALVGGILFSLMIVYFLHWLSSPPLTDLARIPLWGCYGLTALLFLVTGAILAEVGIKRFETAPPLPEQTIKTVEENVSWITNSK
jgi:uncharacterized membrane protein YqjE